MCGRLNVTGEPWLHGLCELLGVDLVSNTFENRRFVNAGSSIKIIRERGGKIVLDDAIWWLLLSPTENGFKPSKYTSFNTRYDKLNVPRSAGYIPFRQSRCIVPAKGFGETEFEFKNGRKAPKHYFDFEAINSAIAFGGLCKDYICKTTGEVVTGCSIITLPVHEKIKHIHSKSTPLMLPQNEVMATWLDSQITDVELFQQWLTPTIYQDLKAYQIDKPSKFNKLGEEFIIEKDIA